MMSRGTKGRFVWIGISGSQPELKKAFSIKKATSQAARKISLIVALPHETINNELELDVHHP